MINQITRWFTLLQLEFVFVNKWCCFICIASARTSTLKLCQKSSCHHTHTHTNVNRVRCLFPKICFSFQLKKIARVFFRCWTKYTKQKLLTFFLFALLVWMNRRLGAKKWRKKEKSMRDKQWMIRNEVCAFDASVVS